jgi:hypothetical protein
MLPTVLSARPYLLLPYRIDVEHEIVIVPVHDGIFDIPKVPSENGLVLQFSASKKDIRCIHPDSRIPVFPTGSLVHGGKE